MKIQKKKHLGGVGVRGRVGGQGGCERRMEVFMKIHKKMGGGGRGVKGGGRGGGGVRVNVNEELKFLGKFTIKTFGGGGSVAEGIRWGGRVGVGVRVDVNAMLG